MPSPNRRAGRPTTRTPELLDAICDGIACGKSLNRVLSEPGMPGYSTVCVWLAKDPEFREQYSRAREAQADFIADEILDIADGGNNYSVERDRLRIHARMWYASKLLPKKYGNKPDAAPVQVTVGVGVVLTEARRAEIMARRLAALEQAQREQELQLAAKTAV